MLEWCAWVLVGLQTPLFWWPLAIVHSVLSQAVGVRIVAAVVTQLYAVVMGVVLVVGKYTHRAQLPTVAPSAAVRARLMGRRLAVGVELGRLPGALTVYTDEEIFSAQRDALRGAKRTALLMTMYMRAHSADVVGMLLNEVALALRLRPQLRVFVMTDADGLWYADTLRDLAGTAAAEQLHLRVSRDRAFCTHAKMLVVDDEVSLITGANFAEEYCVGSLAGHGIFTDLCWRSDNKTLAAALTTEFARVWATGRDLLRPSADVLFPLLVAAAAAAAPAAAVADVVGARWSACVLPPGGGMGAELVRRIDACRRRVVIISPYFSSTRSVCDALARALRRGTRVTIYASTYRTPGSTSTAHWLHSAELAPLGVAGARVCWQRPAALGGALMHAKVWVFDDDLVIGSTNASAYSEVRTHDLLATLAAPLSCTAPIATATATATAARAFMRWWRKEIVKTRGWYDEAVGVEYWAVPPSLVQRTLQDVCTFGFGNI
jgi:phosphatidylserine/phosphatidylglycerophosphate/cardiolipin synthase-like enzyme